MFPNRTKGYLTLFVSLFVSCLFSVCCTVCCGAKRGFIDIYFVSNSAGLCYNEVMAGKLPSYFKPIFWSYDISGLDTDRDRRRIAIDVINYGDWRHWKWILKNYGKKAVREIIEAVPRTEFRPGALRLASLLFSVKKQSYASRSAYAGRR